MIQLGERGEAGSQAQQAAFGPPPSPPPIPFAPFQDPTIHISHFIEGFGVSVPPGTPMIQLGEKGEAGRG